MNQGDDSSALGYWVGLRKNVLSIVVDLSDDRSVDQLWAEVEKTGRPVDVLFDNAGRCLSHGFLDHDDDEWLRAIDTNLVETLLLLKSASRCDPDRPFVDVLAEHVPMNGAGHAWS